MSKQNSEEFNTFFLLQFTEELIHNSRQGAILSLRNIVAEKNQEIKREIKRLIKSKEESVKFEKSIMETPSRLTILKPSPQRNIFQPQRQKFMMKPLAVPKPRVREHELPSQFRYLKPTPTSQQIDLGKLNSLANDPKVNFMECQAPNTPVVVSVPMPKKTNIILNQDEMNEIVKKFSEATKIPFHDGNFKVVFGKLIFSAFISQEKCMNFTIRKIAPAYV